MIEDPRRNHRTLNNYHNALRNVLIAHGIVAVTGIIPAIASFVLSHDQFVHTAGLLVSGGIETVNLWQLRSNIRRSKIRS